MATDNIDFELVTKMVLLPPGDDQFESVTRFGRPRASKVGQFFGKIVGERWGKETAIKFGAALATGGIVAVVAKRGATAIANLMVNTSNSIFEAGQRVEGLETRLAGLFAVLGGQDAQTARASGRNLFQQLALDAAKSAGGVEDFARTFQTVAPNLIGAGFDEKRIRKFSGRAVGVGAATFGRRGINFAAEDFRQALTQGAGERTTPIVNQVLRASGVSNQEFNAQSLARRAVILEQSMSKFDAAIKLFETSTVARVATIQSQIDLIFTGGTRAIFDEQNEILGEVVDLLDRWRPILEDTIGIGSELVATILELRSVFGFTVRGASVLATNFAQLRSALGNFRMLISDAAGGVGRLVGFLTGGKVDLLTFGIAGFTNQITQSVKQLSIFVFTVASLPGLILSSIDTFFQQQFGIDLLDNVLSFETAVLQFKAGVNKIIDANENQRKKADNAFRKALNRPQQRRVDLRVDWGDTEQLALGLDEILEDVHRRALTAAAGLVVALQ